jgi:hypothetical protein
MDLDALDIAIDSGAGGATVWARLAGSAEALPARITRACEALGAAAEPLDADTDRHAWSDAAEFRWAVAHPGLGDPSASASATIVKVPAAPSRLLDVARVLSRLGACRVQCGGAVVLVATAHPVAEVHRVLADRGWRGMVVSGAGLGRLVGSAVSDAFAERVRRALDPDQRFQ